jgi:peptide deformylase
MLDYEIVKYPNPALRKKAKEVKHVSSEQREVLDQMARAMYENEAVGLAAEQVNKDIRLAVIDARDSHGLLKLVNPEIVRTQGAEVMEEGCLSLPGVTVEVRRAEKIKVRAKNERGEEIIFELEGLIARVFQHEIDHLNGKVIIDYLNPIKRAFILVKYFLKKCLRETKKKK